MTSECTAGWSSFTIVDIQHVQFDHPTWYPTNNYYKMTKNGIYFLVTCNIICYYSDSCL